MVKIIIKILLVIVLLCTGFEAKSQVYLIANKSVSDSMFTKSKIIDIYTLNKQFWDDGSRITVVDYKGDTPLKNKFYEALGLTYSQIQRIWLKKQFSGKAMPPKTMKTEKEILEMVSSTPGAIAYISTRNIPDDIKMIVKIE